MQVGQGVFGAALARGVKLIQAGAPELVVTAGLAGAGAAAFDPWRGENPKGSGALFPAINVDVGGSAPGKVYRYDNMWDEAGTTVRIVLKRSPHSPGYLVYTSFPLPKSAPAWRALQ